MFDEVQMQYDVFPSSTVAGFRLIELHRSARIFIPKVH